MCFSSARDTTRKQTIAPTTKEGVLFKRDFRLKKKKQMPFVAVPGACVQET